MNSNVVDEDGFFRGRAVRKGETIGKVSNFSGREAGTSYHLQFDLHVPSKDGWTLVNPYMTLVTAYEQMIGGRGSEIQEDAAQAASAAELVSVPSAYRIARPDPRKAMHKRRLAAHKK